MVKKFVLAGIFLLIIFFSGCLQLRNPSECDNPQMSCGSRAMCYHEVAVGLAVRGDAANAVIECSNIGNLNCVGTTSEMNNCFGDVAEISHNETVCDNIRYNPMQQWIDYAWISYKDECKRKAKIWDYNVDCMSVFFLLTPAALLFIVYRKKD